MNIKGRIWETESNNKVFFKAAWKSTVAEISQNIKIYERSLEKATVGGCTICTSYTKTKFSSLLNGLHLVEWLDRHPQTSWLFPMLFVILHNLTIRNSSHHQTWRNQADPQLQVLALLTSVYDYGSYFTWYQKWKVSYNIS